MHIKNTALYIFEKAVQRSNNYEYNTENIVVGCISDYSDMDTSKDKEEWGKTGGCTVLGMFCYCSCGVGSISKSILYDGGIVWNNGTIKFCFYDYNSDINREIILIINTDFMVRE